MTTVYVNVSAARRGEDAIDCAKSELLSPDNMSSVDAYELAKDLMAAADWAEELAAGQEEAEGAPS